MTVICNTRCLNATLTGTQRYTQKIIENFPEEVGTCSPSPQMSRGIKGHLWEQFILPAKLGKHLLWSPSNSGPLSYQRQVLTIHDVVSVDHPEWFNKNYVKWYNYILPRLCKKVNHIITISEFSKQRILALFGVAESKISVIYNGTDSIRIGPLNDGDRLEIPFSKYLLSLGSLEPRKNIPLLLHAWNNIINQIPDDVGLIIVGGTGNTKIFKDAGINEFHKRVYFTGHIKDAHVAQLYSKALGFVYLSVYEGFGLPPLEAMSTGTPVITGNRTSLPEVVGNAGILVDPFSLAECENAIVELINNENLRLDLSKRSIVQAQKFDWQETAIKTWNVLERF